MQKIIDLGLDDQLAIWVKAPHFLFDRLGGWGSGLVCVRHAWGLFRSYLHVSKKINQCSTVAHGIIGPSPPRTGGY